MVEKGQSSLRFCGRRRFTNSNEFKQFLSFFIKRYPIPYEHVTHILFLLLNFINKRSPSTGLCSLPDLPHEMVHPTVDMFGGVAIIIHPHKHCHYHDMTVDRLIILFDLGAAPMPWYGMFQLGWRWMG